MMKFDKKMQAMLTVCKDMNHRRTGEVMLRLTDFTRKLQKDGYKPYDFTTATAFIVAELILSQPYPDACMNAFFNDIKVAVEMLRENGKSDQI